MSIITTEIIGVGGLSSLDKYLELFRVTETGHILLNPKLAKNILYESLLSHYRRSERPDSRVEILAEIAGGEGGEKLTDFTEALEKFEKERAEEERKARKWEETIGTKSPGTPKVRGI